MMMMSVVMLMTLVSVVVVVVVMVPVIMVMMMMSVVMTFLDFMIMPMRMGVLMLDFDTEAHASDAVGFPLGDAVLVACQGQTLECLAEFFGAASQREERGDGHITADTGGAFEIEDIIHG